MGGCGYYIYSSGVSHCNSFTIVLSKPLSDWVIALLEEYSHLRYCVATSFCHKEYHCGFFLSCLTLFYNQPFINT